MPSDQDDGPPHHLEADHVETALEASASQSQKHTAASRRNRNALVPFHSLPTELIGDIFYLSFSESRTPTITIEGLRNLASVSYAWWQIVKIHPHLWTFVNLSQPEAVQLMLRKSWSLPVSIHWHERLPSEGVAPPLLEAIKVVCTHTHRWKSLNINCRRMEIWDEALKLPLPLLESLALDILRGRNLDLTTFVGGPRLSKLKLVKILPPTNIQTFVGLKALQLDDIRNLPQVDDLLSILRATERLEELRLTRIRVTSAKLEDSQRLEASIALTALVTLALVGCSSPTVVALLCSISCPELKSFSINHHGNGNEIAYKTVLWHLFHTPTGRSLWTTVLHRAPDEANLSQSITITVQYRTNLHILGGGVSVAVAGHGAAPLLSVLGDLPAFPFHHITTIPIHLNLGNLSDLKVKSYDDFLPLVRIFPDVTSVTLYGDYDLTLEVLASLERPQETENGTKWYFPRLEVLRICYKGSGLWQAQFMGAVRVIVQARRAFAGDGLAQLTVEIEDDHGEIMGVEDGT